MAVIFSRLRRFCQLPTLAAVPTVEVWLVDVSPGSDRAARLIGATTDEERERAGRLRTPGHAERWLAARSALRSLLSERLGVAPLAVALTAGPHGKPALLGAELQFNLSHAGDLAVVALAGVEVGVDIERLDRSSRAVERTLTPGERAALRHGDDRRLQLLRVWCRKEALAKAIGTGLGWAPERFDTSAPGAYSLSDLDVPEGYVAALAVAGGPAKIDVHTR
jgi:4'-phosphopantetheinyl transferase